MKTNAKVTAQAKKKKNGFTLIEVIAVLVLLGILAAVAVPKYLDLSENAKERAVDAGIAELNGRETLLWGNTVLSSVGWTTDVSCDTDGLGDDYTVSNANLAGASISFQGDTPVSLTRSPSSATNPGSWAKTAATGP